MKIKDIVKNTIINTNPFWPFSFLNKMPYPLAVNVFIRQYRKFSEIKSIYVRHSLLDGKWVPGLSDIDFVVVIDNNLTAEQELAFLNNFWGIYNKLKKPLPIIGGVEILSTDDVKNMTLLGIKSYQTGFWELIYGLDILEINSIQNNNNTDVLFYAFEFYYELLTHKFFSKDNPTKLFLKEFDRVTQKIIKFVDCYYHIEKPPQCSRTIYDSFHSAMRKLHEVTADTPEPNSQKFSEFKISVKKDASDKILYRDYNEAALFKNELIKRNEGNIENIFFTEPGFGPIVIVKDDLAENGKFNNFLMEIRNIVLTLSKHPPYILTKKIFANAIKLYNPFLYYCLIARNKIMYGKTIINEIEPPSAFILVPYAVRKAIYLPVVMRQPRYNNFSYIHWLLNPDMDHPAINYFLKEIIIMKLLLEKGILAITEEALFNEWKNSYYDSYVMFRDTNKEKNISEIALAEIKFSLARKLTKNLNELATPYINELKM